MGTLKGIVRFTGSFDGLSFYEGRQGTIIVRATGGFKGEAIRTKPNYQRTRENAQEFKQVVEVGRFFRLALRSYLHPMRIPYGHNRVVQLFHRIQRSDTLNVRGARTVAQGLQTKEGKALLDGFELDARHTLGNNFPVDYYFLPEEGSMVLNAFDSSTLHFPEGAVKAELKFRLLKIDFEQLEFQLSEEQEITYSRREVIPATTLSNVIPLGTGVLIGLLSISYFQEVSGQFVSFQERSLRLFI